MKSANAALCIFVLGSAVLLCAQSSPNLENGWKPFGSYDGTHLDTVNLMNGNLMLHLPLIPDVPQRGSLKVSYSLYGTSKDWQASCSWNQTTQRWQCSWAKGGGGISVLFGTGLAVHRTLDKQYTGGSGNTTIAAYGYTITTPDGSTHQLHGVAGTEDANGEPTQFDSTDLSGYHLIVSNPDVYTIKTQVTITDRFGNQYTGAFGATSGCGRFQFAGLSAPGGHPPPFDDAPAGDQYCSQVAFSSLVTDSNGNQLNIHGPMYAGVTTDTLGKTPSLMTTLGGDSTGCISSHPFYQSLFYSYQDPHGVTQQIKVCTAEVPIQTAFNQPNPFDGTLIPEAATGPSGSGLHYYPVSTVILADGGHWTFDYDSYGLIKSVGLPTGGSISYTWTTIDYNDCNVTGITKRSRAVVSRTLNDGQGHSYTWLYTWGTPSASSLSNTVTDPLGNDMVHLFTALNPGNATTPGCNFYETSTIQYQGSAASNRPLQRVDTTYSSALIPPDDQSFYSSLANVFATDIVTTVYPSGKVKKVHKDPDTGLGAGLPIFGNVKKELVYDWGQGAPGPLLRETDTIYKWETSSAYLNARLLDMPASVTVKDASGNRVAETDYTYDEPSYLATANVSTQHVSPPYGIRGNQSTVSQWLNTTNSFITSHTNWYDTGEPYQKIDPLGHTTTYNYDPIYVGGYITQTCPPQTNGGVSHCISGTYDFNSGFLTSLTNENATTQASGNAPGDSAHTSNYSYDLMFRLTSAQAPPDPANGGMRAQNTFSFSPPSAFPITAQRSKSVTTSMSDVTTGFFDGLGRSFKGQHTLPNGTATIDTTFDLAGHTATVSNPYFSTSDPTYGTTTSAYDGLDRVTQTTKQDGSISSATYSVATAIPVAGDCTQTTDEAGKQRRACADGLGRLVEVDETGDSFSGSQASGSFTVSGTLQSGSRAIGSVTIQGAEHSKFVSGGGGGFCGPGVICDGGGGGSTLYDTGSVTITINGRAYTYNYSGTDAGTDTTSTIATGLTSAINNDARAVVTAVASGATVSFTAKAPGPGGNYPLSSSYTWDNADFAGPSFTTANSGSTLTGGSNAGNVYDAGTVVVTIGTFSASASYGNPGNSTAAQVASALATALNASSSPVIASASGATVSMTYKTIGMSGNVMVSCSSSTSQSAYFFGPSFTCPASSSLNGGFNPQSPSLDHAFYATLYFYDALGNLTCVEQHGNVSGTGCNSAPSNDAASPWRVRRSTYDSLSRLLTAKNPESGTISYSYDNDGNLLQKTSPTPNQTNPAVTQTFSYCYDELHRVIGKGYGVQSCPLSSPVVTYTYDSGANAKGKLTGITDQAGSAAYAYDVLGRLSSETRVIAGVSKGLSYSYNLNGSINSLTYPSQRTLTYAYDTAGQAVSVTDSSNGVSYASGVTYWPNGAEYRRHAPAVYFKTTLNNRLQVSNIYSDNGVTTSFFLNKSYDYNAGHNNGNVLSIYNGKDANRTQTFTYDALNRLTSAQNAGTDCAAATVNGKTEYWGNAYGYDAWGNLLGKSVTKCGAENLSVTADAHNWIHATAPDYQYDAAGNMTFDATSSLNYNYDQENRQTGAAGYTYTYDADGNRVKKSNGSTGTLYWYMSPGIVAESDLAGNLKSEYAFFNGKRLIRIDLPSNAFHYYLSDTLNSTSMVVSSSGVIENESDYYPWGGELQLVANDSNHYKFTGKERDAETGLDYFGARYYSNGLGRFMSSDWSSKPVAVPYANLRDPQSLNLYSYAANRPTTVGDEDGHSSDPCKNRQDCYVTKDDKNKTATLVKTQPNTEITKDEKTGDTISKTTTTTVKLTVSTSDKNYGQVLGGTTQTSVTTSNLSHLYDGAHTDPGKPEPLTPLQALNAVDEPKLVDGFQSYIAPSFTDKVMDHKVLAGGTAVTTGIAVACAIAEPCGLAVLITGALIGGGATIYDIATH